MSWSDTTPTPNLGTESSSDASGPEDSAVTEAAQQKRTVAKLGAASVVRVGHGRGFVVKGGYEWDRLIITAAHCLPHFPRPHPAGYLAERTYQPILGPLGEKPTVWAGLLPLCSPQASWGRRGFWAAAAAVRVSMKWVAANPESAKYRAARASSIAKGSGRPFSDGREGFKMGHTIGSGYRRMRRSRFHEGFFLGLIIIDHFVMAITAGQAPVQV